MLVTSTVPFSPTTYAAALTASDLVLTKTTQQLSLNYDGSNKTTFVAASDGKLTMTSTSANGFEWYSGATFLGKLTYTSASGRMLVGSGLTAAFTTSAGGNYSSTQPRFDVTGNPDSGACGIGDGGGTGLLGFIIANVAKMKLSATDFALGPGITAKVGGTIFSDFTDATTTHTDGTEDTLYTHTLQASQLAVNGSFITGCYQLAIVGHAVSTDRIRIYFGGTAIFDTAALNFPLSAALTIEFAVVRVSSTVVRASVAATTNSATVIAYSQYVQVSGLDLTTTAILALKAIATGTNSAASDVTAQAATVVWQPAP